MFCVTAGVSVPTAVVAAGWRCAWQATAVGARAHASTAEAATSWHHAATTDPRSRQYGAPIRCRFDPDLAIFTLVVFVVLLVVLRKFAWGPIWQDSKGASTTSPTHIAAGRTQPRGGQAAAGPVRAEAGAAPDEVASMMEEARRDAEHAQQDDLGRGQGRAPKPSGPGPCATSSRPPTRPWNRWPSAAPIWRSTWPARSLQPKLQPADHARLIQEAVAKFPSSRSQHELVSRDEFVSRYAAP